MGNRKYVMPSLSSWFIGETSHDEGTRHCTCIRLVNHKEFSDENVEIACTISAEWDMIDGFLILNVNVIEYM